MPSYIVRCGVTRTLHVMQARQEYSRNMRVIARTARGLEVGDVLCVADDNAIAQLVDPPGGSIQRELTVDDARELAHLVAKADEESDVCLNVIRELGLEMDLVEIERIFGGERMVIYYLAEGRVDFRELVRRLAHEFQTRIEMKQIGVRDEAKLLADYGDCGKPVCCNTHLVQMPPVSMKMAKLQKATLDPNKISGRCGRLKCCLRYEYDTYEENRKSLPSTGTDVVTAEGRGRVIGQDLLTRQLVISMEDNRRIIMNADQILSVIRRSGSSPKRSMQETDEDSSEIEQAQSESVDENEALEEHDAVRKIEANKERGSAKPASTPVAPIGTDALEVEEEE
ncbi:MAG: signal peptidase [Pirellulaceae bacterium]|nr:signal peptidase [Pirellulaceae bacterium]